MYDGLLRVKSTGSVVVNGKGIRVELLGMMIDDPEWSLERILESYDLTPAEVYAAWSYYCNHQEELDRRMKERDTLAQKLSQENSGRLHHPEK